MINTTTPFRNEIFQSDEYFISPSMQELVDLFEYEEYEEDEEKDEINDLRTCVQQCFMMDDD